MVGRGELTDKSWEWIAPLLPENGRRGRRWRDHRAAVHGILWKSRTGAPWRDLPSCYGPWQTHHDRFVPRRLRAPRRVVNGLLWKSRAGAPWRDLPSCYGPWQTYYDRFVRWRRDGTW